MRVIALAWIWTAIVLFSTAYSLFAGTSAEVGRAALEGGTAAVKLITDIAGPIVLWCGVMEVMRRGGAAEAIARLLRPLLTRLFPSAKRNNAALESLSANVSANMLGLGNAATPLGIRAAEELSRDAVDGGATDGMCLLVVLNTASVQLIPTTVAAVRAGAGASQPFDILPAVWLTSLFSVTVGVTAAKLFARRRR
ncbi:MAG: spore maturation protein A [Oscillospiraceae bacterium]|nr:spore maturation protein A [Oscillospiraceae bacterium]